MTATNNSSAEAEIMPPEADDTLAESPIESPESTALAQSEERGQVAAHTGSAVTPMALLEMAVQRGGGIDELDKLMGLQERWEANEARKSYVAAMAAFKADPPKIVKDKKVSFDTRDGDRTEYSHATLAQVSEAVAKGLGEHGLSHTYKIDQQDGVIRVTCIITHEKGHSESVSLSAGADGSGKKNPIQQVASTVTYLERYTLLAATGLAAADMDDDGKGSEVSSALDENQIEHLEALLKSLIALAPTNEAKFYGYMSKVAKAEITSPEEIPQRLYSKAIQTLNEALGHV